MIGQAYTQWLSPREQEELATGCDLLIDGCFDDMIGILSGQAISDTVFHPHLPDRYLSEYTPYFLKQFLACILTVAWKLAQPKHYRLSSIAEELAAFAIVNVARVPIEEKCGTEAAEQAFYTFCNNYFEDMDFLFLFEEEDYDGIDQGWVGAQTGMTSLAFEDWFKPFSDEADRVAHPYAWEEKQGVPKRKRSHTSAPPVLDDGPDQKTGG